MIYGFMQSMHGTAIQEIGTRDFISYLINMPRIYDWYFYFSRTDASPSANCISQRRLGMFSWCCTLLGIDTEIFQYSKYDHTFKRTSYLFSVVVQVYFNEVTMRSNWHPLLLLKCMRLMLYCTVVLPWVSYQYTFQRGLYGSRPVSANPSLLEYVRRCPFRSRINLTADVCIDNHKYQCIILFVWRFHTSMWNVDQKVKGILFFACNGYDHFVFSYWRCSRIWRNIFSAVCTIWMVHIAPQSPVLCLFTKGHTLCNQNKGPPGYRCRIRTNGLESYEYRCNVDHSSVCPMSVLVMAWSMYANIVGYILRCILFWCANHMAHVFRMPNCHTVDALPSEVRRRSMHIVQN